MNDQKTQDMISANTTRAGFYEFLASIYKLELTEDQIQRIAVTDFPQDETLVGKGYAEIKEYLRHRDVGTRTELAVDYARVFLSAGIYDQIIAPPYESVYTNKERLLMQDARDKALASYRAEGLELPADNTTPEDHLSFEMQFMAKLIERSDDALATGDQARYNELCIKQREFFNQHLHNWVPHLCRDIRKHAETDFYRGIADITEGFLSIEGDITAEIAQAA